jgi:hypothetical protein
VNVFKTIGLVLGSASALAGLAVAALLFMFAGFLDMNASGSERLIIIGIYLAMVVAVGIPAGSIVLSAKASTWPPAIIGLCLSLACLAVYGVALVFLAVAIEAGARP